MASRDIALQRSGFVEKEELYNNEDRRERGVNSGRQTVEIFAAEWTVPKVTGHFHCMGRKQRSPGFLVISWMCRAWTAKKEGGGRGGAGEERSSQSSSPLLN